MRRFASACGASKAHRWTGFYAGAHGGGGWGHENFGVPFDVTGFLVTERGQQPGFTETRGHGVVFGAQFGYDWQVYSHWVTGMEADISGATIKRSRWRGS